jgi:hypothetical protein
VLAISWVSVADCLGPTADPARPWHTTLAHHPGTPPWRTTLAHHPLTQLCCPCPAAAAWEAVNNGTASEKQQRMVDKVLKGQAKGQQTMGEWPCPRSLSSACLPAISHSLALGAGSTRVADIRRWQHQGCWHQSLTGIRRWQHHRGWH